MHTENLKISPITTADDGSYTWTVNGTPYYTNAHGQGLFTDAYEQFYNTASKQPEKVYSGARQLLGTCQFWIGNLSASSRRARVVAHHVRQSQNYAGWLDSQQLADNQQNALDFYHHLQDHSENAGWTCCQVFTKEELLS